MSRFNVFSNHPIIPNSQEYVVEKKYVSINSEDRDVLKYPNSNEFEIELPQDYLNVSTVKLATWSFPSNYNTFSLSLGNTTMTFQFNELYNPGEHGMVDPLQDAIFDALYNYVNPETGTSDFLVSIQEGFYNPTQLATELTNRFNAVITNYLILKLDPSLTPSFVADGGYTQFVVVYNEVSQDLWFGNRSSSFILTNEFQIATKQQKGTLCINKNMLPDASQWGLPANLGFTPCNAYSLTTSDIGAARFYYGSVTVGDNGYWLLPDPDLSGSQISFLKAPYKLNNMGPAYFYMEIAGLNCLDETSPFNVSEFTRHTNETNGVVNSAFAKISVVSTPLSQWFDLGMDPFKYFNPPAERIRKLKIKLRYHNGELVNFGKFNYSFMLEFTMFSPQNIRTKTTVQSYV